jgi:hypothetical protein
LDRKVSSPLFRQIFGELRAGRGYRHSGWLHPHRSSVMSAAFLQ